MYTKLAQYAENDDMDFFLTHKLLLTRFTLFSKSLVYFIMKKPCLKRLNSHLQHVIFL